MTDTHNAGSEDKANGSYKPHLGGMQLRNAKQKLLAAMLRRPSLVPIILSSGIRPDDFPGGVARRLRHRGERARTYQADCSRP